MSRPHADADVFRAIADPTRRRVLDLLKTGDKPVHEIARTVNTSGPTLTHHLNILRNVGLVRHRRAGRLRIYTLELQRLREIVAWLARYEELWRPRAAAVRRAAG